MSVYIAKVMKGIAALTLLSLSFGIVHAQTLKSEITASNKTACKFLLAKDFKGFKQHMKGQVTPDFKYIEAGKAMNFDKMCEGMEIGLGQMPKMSKVENKILKVTEKGNTGTSTIEHAMTGTMMGPDNKPHTMTFIGISTNTYVKQGGKWKQSKMVWGKQTVKMDGKAMTAG